MVKVYIIEALKVAKQPGMGVRINTIMQTCFFAISGVSKVYFLISPSIVLISITFPGPMLYL